MEHSSSSICRFICLYGAVMMLWQLRINFYSCHCLQRFAQLDADDDPLRIIVILLPLEGLACAARSLKGFAAYGPYKQIHDMLTLGCVLQRCRQAWSTWAGSIQHSCCSRLPRRPRVSLGSRRSQPGSPAAPLDPPKRCGPAHPFPAPSSQSQPHLLAGPGNGITGIIRLHHDKAPCRELCYACSTGCIATEARESHLRSLPGHGCTMAVL